MKTIVITLPRVPLPKISLAVPVFEKIVIFNVQ